jgi:hypothetical protein
MVAGEPNDVADRVFNVSRVKSSRRLPSDCAVATVTRRGVQAPEAADDSGSSSLESTY